MVYGVAPRETVLAELSHSLHSSSLVGTCISPSLFKVQGAGLVGKAEHLLSTGLIYSPPRRAGFLFPERLFIGYACGGFLRLRLCLFVLEIKAPSCAAVLGSCLASLLWQSARSHLCQDNLKLLPGTG